MAMELRRARDCCPHAHAARGDGGMRTSIHFLRRSGRSRDSRSHVERYAESRGCRRRSKDYPNEGALWSPRPYHRDDSERIDDLDLDHGSSFRLRSADARIPQWRRMARSWAMLPAPASESRRDCRWRVCATIHWLFTKHGHGRGLVRRNVPSEPFVCGQPEPGQCIRGRYGLFRFIHHRVNSKRGVCRRAW